MIDIAAKTTAYTNISIGMNLNLVFFFSFLYSFLNFSLYIFCLTLQLLSEDVILFNVLYFKLILKEMCLIKYNIIGYLP